MRLLSIKPETVIKPVRLGRTKNLKMGESVYVIGNPGLGEKTLDQTMTEGIVSSPKRKLSGSVYIQTSTAVNPGSSGSPMYDQFGNVIGLVVQKAEIEGAGFAVPKDTILSFLKESLSK